MESSQKRIPQTPAQGNWRSWQVLVCRRQAGVAEGGVGAADVAHRSEVGQGKAVEPLGLVADRAEIEAPVTEVEAAAIPVIDGLHPGVLQRVQDIVVAAVGGQVKAVAAGLADGEEGLQQLALDGGGCCP